MWNPLPDYTSIFVSAVGYCVDWVGEAMQIFMEPPAIYFVGFAVVGAAASVARKFVPMKR